MLEMYLLEQLLVIAESSSLSQAAKKITYDTTYFNQVLSENGKITWCYVVRKIQAGNDS